MKRIIVSAACLLALGPVFAQQKTEPVNTRAKYIQTLLASRKCAVEGIIKDSHSRPIKGVQTFVYQADSSIIASGYTDSTGYYTTNSTVPGSFDLKIVYPNEKIILIKGVPLKAGITPINLKADQPTTDTSISYADIAPKPAEKKAGKGKAASK
jgi:hypothetical protein